jgi:hypothetical protein
VHDRDRRPARPDLPDSVGTTARGLFLGNGLSQRRAEPHARSATMVGVERREEPGGRGAHLGTVGAGPAARQDNNPDGHQGQGNGDGPGHELLFLPPLRPAATSWAFVPPWLLVSRFLPPPDALPPFSDDFGSLAIRAARDLLMPFLRSPSYCLQNTSSCRFPVPSSPIVVAYCWPACRASELAVGGGS